MNRTALTALILTLLTTVVHGKTMVGVASAATTSGRVIPALSLSTELRSYLLTGFSTGVRTRVYYHSAWSLALHTRFLPAERGVDSWIGLGVYAAQRGYRESPTEKLTVTQDALFGPSFRVGWSPHERFQIWAGCIFGVGKLSHLILLAPQDMSSVGIGVNF